MRTNRDCPYTVGTFDWEIWHESWVKGERPLSASFIWDEDWAVIADQEGDRATAQFYPVLKRRDRLTAPFLRTSPVDYVKELENA